MRAIIQRVSNASVSVSEKVCGAINQGLMILIGIEESDGQEDVDWLTRKIAGLRIFADADGKMNQSVCEINGQVLVVSQFTLHASTKKGTRPSFIRAARPEHAVPLYEGFVKAMNELVDSPVETGEFGADMQVTLTNDGPVTIWIDTKNKS
ncbi:MAG: D-tyrosyl-tRNA(Tyr) deacylase [Crocinitomicaceae bacterium]|jgi:D-tyrosyl-tRNA(Tyr) deacylase|nr:D-tyrosyl-tRNA(Tyr) deacylase [Crocinitomicaceae bacterium]|tara:strand:- start:2073 stop:2525 length:453 start_codon:yes stop_codon:yes gene_type:complete